MTGLPYFVRLMGFGLCKARVLGWDVAGTVDAVGKDVTQFQPGDDVRQRHPLRLGQSA